MSQNRLFTIGIPTFNRGSTFLKRALNCCLAQTADNLEILVSDNASTDDTRKVVSEFGARVRYIRNDTNIGPLANFVRLIEEARGEYFSLLQDDDLIHNNFVERARNAFELASDIVVYAAFEPFTTSSTVLINPTLFGPAVEVDWLTGKPTIVDGRIILPMGLFCFGPLPPALAFRMSALKPVAPYLDPKIILFAEKILAGVPAAAGRLFADPWIGAMHLHHPTQLHAEPALIKGGEYLAQYALFQQSVAEIMRPWKDDWRPGFAKHLTHVSEEDRRRWLAQTLVWTDTPSEILSVVDILKGSLPSGIVDEVMASRSSPLRDIARDWTPPALWRAAKRIYKRSS